MSRYLCPRCGDVTDDYAEHVGVNAAGEPTYPVVWLTQWGTDVRCDHAHAKRFERQVEGRGKWSGRTEYRYGLIADRVCWPCGTVMPFSVCEHRS